VGSKTGFFAANIREPLILDSKKRTIRIGNTHLERRLCMENQTLRDLLGQVEREIRKTETLDEQGIELLSRLSADIEELLERNDATTEEREMPIVAQLKQAIDHFEISHPELTHHLSQLSKVLSNAGI
jgi:hypothetical protein